MTSEIDTKIIKRTQESLGKIIKKPTLTDKLLSRPPFRFLHDIFTAVIRNTGVMKGLFTSEELNPENVKDKEAKLAFLQKVVDYLTTAHGRPMPVRIMSIVAGKEPEKTNELLFQLAEAVSKGVNNDEIVSQVLQSESSENKLKKLDKKSDSVVKPVGEKGSFPGPESHDLQKATNKHRKEDVRVEPKNELGPVQAADKDKDGFSGSGRRSVEEHSNKEHVESTRKQHQISEQDSRANSRCDSVLTDKSRDELPTTNNGHDQAFQLSKAQRPASAKGQRIRREEIKVTNQLEETLNDPSSNPRLAPPKPKRSSELLLEDSQTSIGLLGKRVSGLIIPESQQNDEDDDDDKFIEETIGGGTVNNLSSQWNPEQNEENQDHGGLVNKILQSKKEFETGNLMDKTLTEIQNNSLNDAAREREREIVEKEIGRLCDSLQTLSRSSLPLGKLMDFIQEDLECMQQEYERWKNENQQLTAQLKQEESLTQTAIEPLKVQLEELEMIELEKRKAIAKYKAKILHNDERIQNLLFKSLGKVS